MADVAAGAPRAIRIVALGDSLTAGYGLPPDKALPRLLEARLRSDGFSVHVANAGVSGDTAEGGLARLDWSVPDGTDLVILELGANDMLRGAPPARTEATLAEILVRLRARGIPVVLAGMRTIANWGDKYAQEFDAIYPALAKRFETPLYPFLLQGVAGVPSLTQPDGLHPNAEGAQRVADALARFLEPVLTARFPADAKPGG